MLYQLHLPVKLPSSDTGIDDSGASGTLLPALTLLILTPGHNYARACDAIFSPYTLLGLGPFADQGCHIIFTNKDVSVHNPQGWRGKKRALVYGVSPSKLHQLVLFPRWHLPHRRYRRWPAASAPIPAEASMPLMMPTKLAQSWSTCWFLSCLPWVPCQANVARCCEGGGNCDSFDGLTSNIARYCPDSDETILGHLAQQRQKVRSTRPRAPRTSTGLPSPVIEPTPLQ